LTRYAIIVAAGRGTRMQTAVPKQFLKLNGKPVVLHSMQAFLDFDPGMRIIVVLPHDQFSHWEKIREEYSEAGNILIAAGGETRFESVKNGLAYVEEEDAIIAVHDAVRPLVNKKTIANAFKAAEFQGNGVPAIPLTDSIRQIESSRSVALDRSLYCLIQTPQVFQAALLRRAYAQEYRYTFTDDASVVESLGESIRLVDGNADNFKITTPTDLVIAEAVLKSRASQVGDLSGGTHP
jgi:2-C-methyl-D-erythritol 4-phosphate cytidylyltransferase